MNRRQDVRDQGEDAAGAGETTAGAEGSATAADAAATAAAADLRIERWGTVPYDEALGRQLELHARRVAGEVPDTLVLVEHPPTFTLGRHAPAGDVVLDSAELSRRGIAVARSDRGGRATYHGPGQVVLYPIVSVDGIGLGARDWVCLLEGALIDTLADYGVRGFRRPATAGIWTSAQASEEPASEASCDASGNASRDAAEAAAGAKIASLGLRIARGVSYHGIALNTGLDASVFDCIVTCGVRGERVTTIATVTGTRPDDDEVASRLAGHVAGRIRDARSRRSGAGLDKTSRSSRSRNSAKREP